MKNSVAVIILVSCLAGGQAFAASSDSVDLRSDLTPVKHQGRRNTCNTFAATALMEFLLTQKTGEKVDLSEQYNYYVGKHQALSNATLRRSYVGMDGLAGYLAVEGLQYGSALESAWPYEAQNLTQQEDPRCVKPEGSWKQDCFTGVLPQDLPLVAERAEPLFMERAEIADFLQREKVPVVVNLMWYPKTANAQGDVLRLPTATEVQACLQKREGCYGHVVLLVGYDPAAKRFIFRNSWGEKWGKSGYGTLPEAYVLEHCEMCDMMKRWPEKPQFAPETEEMVQKSLKGVSARLLP